MDIARTVGAERLREITPGCWIGPRRSWPYGGRWTSSPAMVSWLSSVPRGPGGPRRASPAEPPWTSTPRSVTWRPTSNVRMVWTSGCGSGLNSGQVIAGEVGSGATGYTAIGEQVGMAQRMESVAPAGGVMLSASTARLVENLASLGDPNGFTSRVLSNPSSLGDCWASPTGMILPLGPYRLWSVASGRWPLSRACCGVRWRATARWFPSGFPGIGKSRLVREATARAAARAWRCSRPTANPTPPRCRSTPWRVSCDQPPASRILTPNRPVSGCGSWTLTQIPKTECSSRTLLASRDPEVELPKIDPDARRRRLTALVNTFAGPGFPGGVRHRGRPLD